MQVVSGVARVQFQVAFYGSGAFDFTAKYAGSGPAQPSTSGTVTVRV